MNIYNVALPLGLRCDKCNSIGIWDRIDFYEYFSGNLSCCPYCEKTLDLYRIYCKAISEHFMFFDAFHCIGATSTTFQFTLEESKPLKIKYSEFGIPEGAIILNINYTPEGCIFPAETHLNNPLMKIDRDGPIVIYPIKFEEGPSKNKVNAMITWINSKDDIFDNLIDAFYYYSIGDYSKSVIPANVVVEFKLNNLINTILSNYAPNKQIKEFLINSATYSSQLNILLPYIVSMQANPLLVLPDEIRGNLNRLRKKRNKIAHKGEIELNLLKQDIAEMLTAALFGYIYLDIANKQIKDNSFTYS